MVQSSNLPGGNVIVFGRIGNYDAQVTLHPRKVGLSEYATDPVIAPDEVTSCPVIVTRNDEEPVTLIADIPNSNPTARTEIIIDWENFSSGGFFTIETPALRATNEQGQPLGMIEPSTIGFTLIL